MTSFSSQLDAILCNNTTFVTANDELFFAELIAVKQWLKDVFADDNLQLLGYIGNPRFLDGTVHPLDVYARVNDLFFCLRLSRSKSRKTLRVFFQLGYLQNVSNKNGRKSCFRKLGSLCRENTPYKTRLDFFLLCEENEWPKLPNDEETLTELRTALVATCFNTLKSKPILRSLETIEQLQKELFEKSKFVAFDDNPGTDAAVLVVTHSSPFVIDEGAYLASLDKSLLERPIAELIQSKDGMYLRDAEKLAHNGIFSVRDLMALTFEELGKLTHYASSYIYLLADHDLELKPNNYAARLAPGIPKTVKLLFSRSGLDYIERPTNCLTRGKIFSTSQLLDKTPADLLAITNFGKVSLAITTEALKIHGLKLLPQN